MHVAVLPDERAARNPHGLALADEHNGELTSAHLLQRVQVAAEHLAKAGVGAGDAAEGSRAFAEKRPAIWKGR